jgi:dolichol-phosphate mannosyltransferase
MIKKNTRGFSYSIVLATYKEYPNLKQLLPQLCAIMEKRKAKYEIVIVDDNSNDGTEQLVAQLKKKKKPLRLTIRKKERGLASALIKGTHLVKMEHIIRMDADWSHHPKDLVKMMNFYERQPQPQVVIGSRFVRASVYTGKPFINRVASLTARTACRILFRIPVIDLSNDFRIFPKKTWRSISSHLTISGNAVLIQEIILFHKSKIKITEIPTTFKEREVGNSKLVLLNEIERFFTAFPILFLNSVGSIGQNE